MRKLTTLIIDSTEAPALGVAAGAPALRELVLSGGGSRPPVGDADCQAIAASFPRLEQLTIADDLTRSITPDGLRALAALPKLTVFRWGRVPLSVENAAALAEFPALEFLSLVGSGIQTTHLVALAKSKSITLLYLNDQPLTPADLEPLRELRTLRNLLVKNTGITPEQLVEIGKMLPKCYTRYD